MDANTKCEGGGLNTHTLSLSLHSDLKLPLGPPGSSYFAASDSQKKKMLTNNPETGLCWKVTFVSAAGFIKRRTA